MTDLRDIFAYSALPRYTLTFTHDLSFAPQSAWTARPTEVLPIQSLSSFLISLVDKWDEEGWKIRTTKK